MVHRSLLVLLLFVLVLMGACGDGSGPAPAVLSVSIDQGEVTLAVGASATLSATVSAVGGASTAVEWSSDDASVASVSSAGVVTAVAEGESVISATSSFDDSRSASIAVTVVLGGGEDVVTMVAPVAPLPGASADDLVVVTPFGEYSVGPDVVEGTFAVMKDSVSIVGLMDTARDFGWTALYPYWFMDVDAVSRSSSTLASAHEVGPLSTAVSLVLLTPNLSTRDPALLPGMVSVLRSVPAVVELAGFLEDHSAALDPLAVPGFAGAYERAVDAAIDAVDGAVESAVTSSDQVQRAGVVPIDQVFTVVNESGGLVSVEWDASVWPINRTVTHLGVIYEVDASAYASESALRIELLNVGPNVAPALVSSDPVARISLPAEDPAAVIDVIGLAIGVVFDAVFGLFGPRDLPAANEQVLPEGAYIVHLQGCATMTSPLSLLHPDMGNYARDIEIIVGWPGSSAVGNAVNACALFAFENAVDAVSLLVNISDYLGTNWYLKHPWPDVWETVADVLFDLIIATGSEGAALNSTQLNDVILLFLPALLESAAETAAQKVAEEGLRALLELKARALTSLVDLPGKLSSAASLTARSVTAEGITPLESSLVIVGDPWRDTDVSVSLSPSSATLPVNGTQSFTATVTGASDTSVTWSATCGSISGSGSTVTYTAPGTQGECAVSATSVADPSATASATVTVMAGGSVGTQREIIVASGPVGGADTDLYVISRDDGASRLLLDTPGRVTHAFWNAERNALLITNRTTDTDRDHRLVRFDEEGRVISNERLVRIEGPSCCHGGSYVYGWHPLGDSILYKKAEFSCSGNRVWRRGLDGAETVFLDPSIVGHGVVYTVDFHPNGREVLWTSQRGCSSPSLAIYRADVVDGAIDVSTIRVLLDDGQYVSPARYSPDGSLIAFKRSDAGRGYDGPENVYVMAADGSDVRALTTNTSAADRIVGNVAWSPDGTHVAFGRSQDWTGDRTVQVYVADVNGVAVTRVTDGSGQDLVLAW